MCQMKCQNVANIISYMTVNKYFNKFSKMCFPEICHKQDKHERICPSALPIL